jgi:adenine-specific DNA-methyltransferase
MARKRAAPKTVETITHVDDRRTNIPTAEYQSVLREDERASVRVAYERRNRDLDPQLVWRGKDEQDWSDLVVHAPPLYIQEKVHPKVLIDELIRQSKKAPSDEHEQIDLFADFNRLPEGVDKTEFYEHEQGWTNRMILGDSLQVMASLAEREGLRGKVQCIYIDPPYGIRFNSNFQWSTSSRDVTDGRAEHITREPEQVRAFRDTWRDGVHSYLGYLRDRLTVARDLLSPSGSIFIQIGDENVHRVRSLLDEIFGEENFVALITCKKTTGNTTSYLPTGADYVLWYAKNRAHLKYRPLLAKKSIGGEGGTGYTKVELANGIRRGLTAAETRNLDTLEPDARVFSASIIVSQSIGREKGEGAASWFPVHYEGRVIRPSSRVRWKTNEIGMERLKKANRLYVSTGDQLSYVRYFDDFPAQQLSNVWTDTVGQNQFGGDKIYVVQTALRIVERCLLMATDPGDLVLDPTCGSGTTAVVAEQWGRRWVTVDTSRVALALARARVMGVRFAYYLLRDSLEGQEKESEISGRERGLPSASGSVRQGFVYQRVPHIMLGAIVKNAEIEVIWDSRRENLEAIRERLNRELGVSWEEWQVPREASDDWPEPVRMLHSEWWAARQFRQDEIDHSIARNAEFELLYDKPYEDKRKVRVAGPFTVESVSPHRVLGVDENDELIDPLQSDTLDTGAERTFTETILENLNAAGVQQAHKEDKIEFTSLAAWPGELVCAEGRYLEGETEKRAGIFIGPEFGTVQRPDLVAAAREAGDAGFDVLIACAFSYDAHATELGKLGGVPVLKARMNADLHMADDLKATGKGNLFVVFGEPDIELLDAEAGKVQVKLNGVDVFDPTTGEVRSDNADGIACWFVDTDYNEESFFVRHAYFLGADDPYKALKTTLKAEIDEDAWATLHSDVSRPFDKPATGRIAVKVINHLGDEVMKVFRVN